MFSDARRGHKKQYPDFHSPLFPAGPVKACSTSPAGFYKKNKRLKMSEEINVPGMGNVEITNWDEFREKVLFLIGTGIVQEIQNEAMRMGLFQSGRYIRGFHHYVDMEGNLNIDNDVYYAPYLEFGTYDYFDIFGLDDYPNTPLKKKDLSKERVKDMEKGMMPFAPMRRVLYNQAKIDAIIERSFA